MAGKNGSDIVTVNGAGYAEKLAQGERDKGLTAKVVPDRIPTWGGGGTEPGHRVVVSSGPAKKRIIY